MTDPSKCAAQLRVFFANIRSMKTHAFLSSFILRLTLLTTFGLSGCQSSQTVVSPAVSEASTTIAIKSQPSEVLRHPVILRIMELKLVPDFKPLVDVVPKELTDDQKTKIEKQASKIRQKQGEKAQLEFLLNELFIRQQELLPVRDFSVMPQFTLRSESPHKPVFDHIENTWQQLLRKTPLQTKSTLIPLPHPIVIPGDRFQEAYYWDTFFTAQTLIDTDRSHLVKGQIENFIFLIKNYGLVPNGNRDYYLSRSQPPFLSRMVQVYLKSHPSVGPPEIEWLRNEILPWLEKDYEQFWMNPETRLDLTTGLNHHYDALNTPRPERHASDSEESLAKTYRDVRAEAESGKDFTNVFEGEITKYNNIMLNSLLFGIEMDLFQFSKMVGDNESAEKYAEAAMKRKQAMIQYMQDPKTGLFFDYRSDLKQRSSILTADTFAPFFFGVSDPKHHQQTLKLALKRLKKKGGIVTSEVQSGKQWDSPYGWAPYNYIAVEALSQAGLTAEAQDVARRWVETVDRVYTRLGAVIEKYDMITGDSPIETQDKYKTQRGFGWTNGVYVQFIHRHLGEKLIPLKKQ